MSTEIRSDNTMRVTEYFDLIEPKRPIKRIAMEQNDCGPGTGVAVCDLYVVNENVGHASESLLAACATADTRSVSSMGFAR
jgi:hypothetical protein